MFSKLFGTARPTTKAGKQCFDLITQIRRKQGYDISQYLPITLADNSEFMGTLLGLMSVVSDKTGEASYLKSSTHELIQKLFGHVRNTNSWSEAMIHAVKMVEAGADNEQLLGAFYIVTECLESGASVEDLEQKIFSMVVRFFPKR